MTMEERTTRGGDDQSVSWPTKADLERIRVQCEVIVTLTQERYGQRLLWKMADLSLLQRILDDELLSPEQTYELQCLGVAFGRVMQAELPFQWIAVEDSLGRDPALQYKNSSIIVYPTALISKRVEDGREVNLEMLWHALMADITLMEDEMDPSKLPPRPTEEGTL